MESNKEESDQLPEEGPGQQVPDDDGDDNDNARSSAEENPGVPDSEGQATGNPAAAGSDEEHGSSSD